MSVVPVVLVESVEPVEAAGPDDGSPFGAAEAPAPARLPLPRSFFAHPEPLKWTAGAANDLRIVPPQIGQCDGPCPWRPWTTSISWPQAEQM